MRPTEIPGVEGMDIGRARARIRELSDLPTRDIEPLGAGADSAAFGVDAEWVVRFPLVPEARESLRRELALLPQLAPELPVAVPAPEHVGEEHGQLAFSAYRMLEGEPLSDAGLGALSPSARRRALDQLAALLDAIHGFSLRRARAAGVRFELCKGAYHPEQDRLEQEFADQLGGAEHRAIARQRQVFAQAQASAPTPVLLHADIKPAHLLHDPSTGALTGLLDWGDACLGHGDFDLAIVGAFCGPRTLDGLMRRLDPAERERARLSIPFLLTVRWLADAVYIKRRGGGTQLIAGALRRLREHLQADTARAWRDPGCRYRGDDSYGRRDHPERAGTDSRRGRCSRPGSAGARGEDRDISIWGVLIARRSLRPPGFRAYCTRPFPPPSAT